MRQAAGVRRCGAPSGKARCSDTEPGGALRGSGCGAIAAHSPSMAEVIDAANKGMPVLGICNGFQILVEAHLLPGGLIRNDHGDFICRDQVLRV